VLDDAMAWWYHAAAFLYITGLLLALGTATASLLRADIHFSRLVTIAGPLLLVAGVAARLFAQVQMAFGEMGGVTGAFTRLMVFDTPWGWGWRWQAATAAAVLAAVVVRAVPSRPRGADGPVMRVVAWLFAVSAAFAAAATGHAMAFPELTWLMVPLHALHAIGAGLWMGTLAVLLMALGVIGAGAPDAAARREEVAVTFARFSAIAVAAVGVMALTGIGAGALHLGEWPALWNTAYGRMLLIKVGVFLLVGACGAYNWQRVRPALPFEDGATRRLRRVGGLEVALGVLALLLTSVLAALPMPAEG
jgi:putative copper export protein